MTDNELWITIGLMTLATVITRSSFFLLADHVTLPPRVQHALRYAPAAALAAIVAPDLVAGDGVLQLTVLNPKLLAGIAATLFYLRTRHLLATIAVGMLCFTVVRLMLS